MDAAAVRGRSYLLTEKGLGQRGGEPGQNHARPIRMGRPAESASWPLIVFGANNKHNLWYLMFD
jgi:hypothetical protein